MCMCRIAGEMSIRGLERRQGFFFFFFATYPEFLMGILHNWSSAFPWGRCNHLTSFFFICIPRNWWFDPMGSLYLFMVTFVHFRSILCYLGKRERKKINKMIWRSLLCCQFFLLHQGRCAFPNLILSWSEGGRNQRNDYRVGGGVGKGGLVRGIWEEGMWIRRQQLWNWIQ